MPNYVYQRVTFTGEQEVIHELKAAVKTKHKATQKTDYKNRLIFTKTVNKEKIYGYLSEKPKEFEYLEELVEGKNNWIKTKELPPDWEPEIEPAWTDYFDFERIIPPPPFIFRGDLSIEQEKKSPNRNWYQWNINNWGTKWAACQTKYDKEGRLLLQTAWSTPDPIFKALSFMFPELTLTVEYLDEGWNFWGIDTYAQGTKLKTKITTPNDCPYSNENGEYDPVLLKLEKELRNRDVIKEQEDEE